MTDITPADLAPKATWDRRVHVIRQTGRLCRRMTKPTIAGDESFVSVRLFTGERLSVHRSALKRVRDTVELERLK